MYAVTPVLQLKLLLQIVILQKKKKGTNNKKIMTDYVTINNYNIKQN